MRKRQRPFSPIVILFIALNAFFVAGKGMLQRWSFDQAVLIGGNLVLVKAARLDVQVETNASS